MSDVVGSSRYLSLARRESAQLSKHAVAAFQRQSIEPLGPGQISFRLQHLSQVEHRRQCVGVLLPQQSSHGLEHQLLDLACPVQISLCVQRLGLVVHRR
jgi:hypothetical protein